MMQSKRFDNLGIVLSGICLVHCTLLPILLTAFPFIPSDHDNDIYFHWLMIALIVPLAMFLFIKTYRLHGLKRPMLLGLIGSLLLMVGPSAISFADHSEAAHILDRVVTSIGSVFIMLAHFYNLKACRCEHH
jgi:hypothetical protein